MNKSPKILEDVYNVNKYTDSELFNILDLVNPSDRELEAKIIQSINKYNNIGNDDALKIAKFFHDIYDHFFDTEDEIEEEENINYSIIENFETEENEEPLQEGFTGETKPPTPTTTNTQDVTSNSELYGGGNVGYTQVLEYTKDKLNPVLKETIKRIITIDSQFRDVKTFPLTTNFSFNLSETLKDVVSLKLYSYQIPYTWYTINNNFGANFFYIKGYSDGINVGNYEIRVEIPSGNYTPQQLADTVNLSVSNLSNTFTDISFGNTQMIYNTVTSKTTLSFDIQQIYSQSFYEIHFPNSMYVGTIPTPYSLLDRKQSIQAFLGFESNRYSLNSVYSNRTLPLSTLLDKTIYDLSTCNNYFTVYSYTNGYNFIDPITSGVTNKVIVELDPKTYIPGQKYTRTQLIYAVNHALQTNYQIDSSNNGSLLERIDISGINMVSGLPYDISTNGLGEAYLKLMVKLNRYSTKNIINTRTVVVFPDETALNSPIWTGEISAFQFKNRICELNTLYSESYISNTNYIIGDNNNTHNNQVGFYLNCTKPFYGYIPAGYEYNFTIYTTQVIPIYGNTIAGNTINGRQIDGDINLVNDIANPNPLNFIYNIPNRNYDPDLLTHNMQTYGDPDPDIGLYYDINLNYNINTATPLCYKGLDQNGNPIFDNELINQMITNSDPDYPVDDSNFLGNLIIPNSIVSQNKTIPLNNYIIYLKNSNVISQYGYSLEQYAKAINDGIQNPTAYTDVNFPNIDIKANEIEDSYFEFDPITSIPNFKFKINRVFDNSKYTIDFSGTLFKTLNFSNCYSDPSYNNQIDTRFPIDLSINPILYTRIPISATGYPFYYGVAFTISPNKKYFSGNYFVLPLAVWNTYSLSQVQNYSSHILLENAINSFFRKYTDANNDPILYGSSISLTVSPYGNFIDCVLKVKITNTLTQDDYYIQYFDNSKYNLNDPLSPTYTPGEKYATNSWIKYLFVEDVSYSLVKHPDTEERIYSRISGSQAVHSDILNLTNANNTIIFKPIPGTNGLFTPNNTNDIIITLPLNNGIERAYTRSDLISEINNQLYANSISTNSLISFDIVENNTYFNFVFNKIYTAKDYYLDFYDPYSFSTCISTSHSGVMNATWDSTLGWILGFRNQTFYNLVDFVVDGTNIVQVTGDTTLCINIYNYFMIILDDFNQNRLNDGIVNISKIQTSLSLPKYTNKALLACDPVTGKKVTTNLSGVSNNNLTQKQIYAAQTIIDSQNNIENSYMKGPFSNDVFAMIPIKVSGMQQNQTIVEYGGTMQNQERLYFGPVNIGKMSIQLMNDKGEVVDLNGSNWSFSFICEQLYQNTNTKGTT